ncbi:hypothetical protein PHMEG_00038298 [Phytophthora megakarya]|uniref:Alpha-type protein kinase domain-containing protein n=1 Tax=Phytophthora megakarya TaxID=4795 RepID=A0A225UHY6_9STRA|nr:hypothetical protein PHMEG_00038298 [Phytophthora megakarya]
MEADEDDDDEEEKPANVAMIAPPEKKTLDWSELDHSPSIAAYVDWKNLNLKSVFTSEPYIDGEYKKYNNNNAGFEMMV